MAGRQLGTFLLLGLGVELGFAAVDAMFGQRKVVVKDSYIQQSPQQPSQYPPPPHSFAPLSPLNAASTTSSPYTPSSPLSSSPPLDNNGCYQALSALSDCESRHGYGSDKCRFFRSKADECQQQQAAFFAHRTAEQR